LIHCGNDVSIICYLKSSRFKVIEVVGMVTLLGSICDSQIYQIEQYKNQWHKENFRWKKKLA
jgi:hypothetical protein